MRRGFLKAAKYKKSIKDEGNPSRMPPDKDHSCHTLDGKGSEQTAANRGCDVADVEMTDVQEVYADGCIAAVRLTKKHDGENDDEGESHLKAKDAKGKGKAKMAGSGDDNMDTSPDHDPNTISVPLRPPPQSRGWGRDPEEDIFHKVPQSHGGAYRKRTVFRFWPRDPNGKPFIPHEKLTGKLSPDGYPWGATLYDIFQVNRLPDVPNMMSIMTGSSLCQYARGLGELNAAAPEIQWALSEGEPRSLGAADTEELIWSSDMMLQFLGSEEVTVNPLGVMEDDEDEDEKENSDEDEDGYEDTVPTCSPTPFEIPATSPFHPSHYPAQWPSIPFEHPLSILLQERIPLYLLPQTLYVHDPFCLLAARKHKFHNTSWTSRPDIIRTYDLYVSYTVRSQVEEARRKAEELEEFKARTLIVLRYTRTKEQIKNHEPMIEVPLPPHVRRPMTTEESHLYLSPVAKVGVGNHSIVYKGEWELPRTIFTKEKICRMCLKEGADKEIQRLKDTGRWEKMLRAASWGPEGHMGREPPQEELDAVNNAPNLTNSEEIIEREIICIVPPNVDPSQVVKKLNEFNVWEFLMKNADRNCAVVPFVDNDEDELSADSYIARMRINPGSRKACTHAGPFDLTAPPPTAKFTVVAKLSLENDPHLLREARNYQNFPEHFFHHFNGYTIISQMHAIVPVNAIVPQFYGYYKPKEEVRSLEGPSYLSPILLIEHCGKPVKPRKISREDQEECVSMLLRFQRAGWLHESVAPRNFLVQYGKPTEFPIMRECNPEPSFRLIDFGRSCKYQSAAAKHLEEREALGMFQKVWGSVNLTMRL